MPNNNSACFELPYDRLRIILWETSWYIEYAEFFNTKLRRIIILLFFAKILINFFTLIIAKSNYIVEKPA